MDAAAALTFDLEPADGPASLALQDAFFAEVAALYPGYDPRRAPSADPAEVAAPRGAWVVVRAGGEPVGCGGVKRLDDETAEVKRVFLAPSVRGRGTGRRLLGELERHAARLGYARVRLDTGARQPAALALFRSAGYREIADYNANPFAAHWLEKALPGRGEEGRAAR